MVSRSFGHSFAKKVGQIPLPSISVKHIYPGDLICVASDGFWDKRWDWKSALQYAHLQRPKQEIHLQQIAETLMSSLKTSIPQYRDNVSLGLFTLT
jgi:serine/threonine protein phosphatase PrpC